MINQKIAELKGLTFAALGGGPKSPWDDLTFNWAESIADAWALFEEMPFPSIDKDLLPHDEQYTCEFASKLGGDEYGAVGLEYENAKAATAPMAICLAWLKWKTGPK